MSIQTYLAELEAYANKIGGETTCEGFVKSSTKACQLSRELNLALARFFKPRPEIERQAVMVFRMVADAIVNSRGRFDEDLKDDESLLIDSIVKNFQDRSIDNTRLQ